MTAPAPDDDALRGTVADRIRASDSKIIKVTPREVAAAKVRVTADRTMGYPTPEWIVRLANAE
ncbi:hypothetical protein MF406_12235 [Georgenia sp. TF02-10]|uniref:hypothetical protein n=1 Tax=Georgenia sp. TF02-10 TaxID=2917725 RepID=UPI001FA7F028|nr:hypothetical protein [Georgenia sp. TF02-10]UNX53750.1 hypothetical protein MF406_12235 [Georgenia sp. TF02-10]